ncbi:MAG: hypothetical protein HY231_25520 [Acidobacteria bacterium]|nr:hypothetical protein [Acidobacteriota bacterium]
MLIPKILTLIYLFTALLLAALLLLAAFKHRNPQTAAAWLNDLKELGATATNRWLRGLRWLLVVLMVSLLVVHGYWIFRADHTPEFDRAKRLDARHRRLAESGLKGWVYDRTGKPENALIRYRADAGVITREYPLGSAAVHLTGFSDYVLGQGGFESAYQDLLTTPISKLNQWQSPTPVGKDLKTSLDANLQREAYSLLQATKKPAAAVVLLLPNNEVLALATAPSFDPQVIHNEAEWLKLSNQVEDALPLSPLVNRALGTLMTGGTAFYYRPGSTFKTFIAAVAIDSGVTEEVYQCTGEGFTPPGSGREIKDYHGEVHGTVDLRKAFQVSCNQYFARLGVKLGRERLANYARRLHFSISPDDKIRRALDFWHTDLGSLDDLNYIFAPPIQKLDFSSKASEYDIALQSIGQGYADLTVMEMAIIAAAAASNDGAYVSPTMETGGPRKVINEFIKPQSAEKLRALMRLVVAPGGTAAGAFANRLSAAGKTGTADREVLKYDGNGKPMIEFTDKEGRAHYQREGVTDGWFVGFAPAENPQIAFAVMVENGGQGAKSAAPIAAKLIEKAQSLGYVRSNANSSNLPQVKKKVQRTK